MDLVNETSEFINRYRGNILGLKLRSEPDVLPIVLQSINLKSSPQSVEGKLKNTPFKGPELLALIAIDAFAVEAEEDSDVIPISFDDPNLVELICRPTILGFRRIRGYNSFALFYYANHVQRRYTHGIHPSRTQVTNILRTSAPTSPAKHAYYLYNFKEDSYQSCLESPEEVHNPLHPLWAAHKNILWYKARRVATINLINGRVKFKRRFKFLEILFRRQVLKEEL